MTSQYQICRLCCNTFEKKHERIISGDMLEMLQRLLIKVDLTVSEYPVICKTCHNALEEHYKFKIKCMHTENYVRPLVVQNVKIHLDEVNPTESNQDNSVCHLCLLFTESCVTCTRTEKEQFQRWFPEISLNTTNSVVFCLTCYEGLQKYFIFVASCVELEDQLCYKVLLQKGFNTHNLDNGQTQIVNEVVVLNEELDIKCDTDLENRTNHELKPLSTDECASNDSLTTYKCKECSYQTETRHSFYRHVSEHLDYLVEKIYKCILCDLHAKDRREIKRHIQLSHPYHVKKYVQRSKIRVRNVHKCSDCQYQTSVKLDLNKHIRSEHVKKNLKDEKLVQSGKDYQPNNVPEYIDISKIRIPKIHKCNKCQYQTSVKMDLNKHIRSEHRRKDSKDEILIHAEKEFDNLPKVVALPVYYTCNKCNNKFRKEAQLQEHLVLMHTETGVFKCDECGFESTKPLDYKHAIQRDPVMMYKCTECVYESKCKYSLDKHINSLHVDSSFHSRFLEYVSKTM